MVKVDTLYKITSPRFREPFLGVVRGIEGEWARVLVTSGAHVGMINGEVKAEAGEETRVRISLTSFDPSEPVRTPDPVPMSRWGMDHWSTFAFLETVAVDLEGRLDEKQQVRMRTDRDRHPAYASGFQGGPPRNSDGTLKKYPTRLREGELPNHDDWDCMDDMVAAGLLENVGTPVNPIVRFTDSGHALAAELRRHKAAGENFANFVP